MNLRAIVVSTVLSCAALFATPVIGDKACEFELPSLTSPKAKVQMKDYDKDVVLLNVWASWCKGCKREMPFFHEVGKQFKSKAFEVVAINIDTNANKANSFLYKLKDKLDEEPAITFVYDEEKTMAKAYDAKAVPFSLLIKKGKIIKTYLGSFDDESEAALLKDIKAALK
jgi:thiol-disulfide isomerase/thioredoxin